MIQKKSPSKKAGWRYLLLTPMIAAIIIISFSSFIIKHKVDSTIASISPSMPQVHIKGVITDQYKNPIAKATVLLYGTRRGTITNSSGQFELRNVPEGGFLNISMMGYSSIYVQIKSGKKLRITLYPKLSHIDEMVVLGYSTASPKPVKSNNHPFTLVEQMPSFPGGKDALMRFLHNNIRYPQEARKEFLQGTVIVSFTVDKDGSLSGIHTINDSLGGGLEQEAIRLVKAMPKWIPARQNRDAAAVSYTFPIRFILEYAGTKEDAF